MKRAAYSALLYLAAAFTMRAQVNRPVKLQYNDALLSWRDRICTALTWNSLFSAHLRLLAYLRLFPVNATNGKIAQMVRRMGPKTSSLKRKRRIMGKSMVIILAMVIQPLPGILPGNIRLTITNTAFLEWGKLLFNGSFWGFKGLAIIFLWINAVHHSGYCQIYWALMLRW